MKNVQDIKDEIKYLEDLQEQARTNVRVFDKVDATNDSRIESDKLMLIYTHRRNLENCLEIIEELKKNYDYNIASGAQTSKHPI